jgi:hypothetical protein
MSRRQVEAARCEALFVSDLQGSQCPDPEQVRQAVARAIRALGVRGCCARVAQEFGDHPETAVARMRWARQVVSQAYPAPGRTRTWVLPAGAAQRPLEASQRPLEALQRSVAAHERPVEAPPVEAAPEEALWRPVEAPGRPVETAQRPLEAAQRSQDEVAQTAA